MATLLTLLAVLVFFGLLWRPINPQSPGGIKRLHRLAQTSRPLMTDVEHYGKLHGSYPSQITDLYPDYYVNKKRQTGWYYEGWTDRATSHEYFLSINPGDGHDPLLRFERRTNGSSQWAYDPGDGTPATPLPFSILPNSY
ncbi:MAG: hypothetical protein ACRYFS_14745 [Janthinobacterium lividum]